MYPTDRSKKEKFKARSRFHRSSDNHHRVWMEQQIDITFSNQRKVGTIVHPGPVPQIRKKNRIEFNFETFSYLIDEDPTRPLSINYKVNYKITQNYVNK